MQKNKILVVADSLPTLERSVADLREAGHDVMHASTTAAYLALLKQHHDIALILLGESIDGVKGAAHLNKIRAQVEAKDVPVILHTKSASNQPPLETIQAGIYHYLDTTYDRDTLLPMVNAILRSSANKKRLQEEMGEFQTTLSILHEAQFRFRTLDEARQLAYLIALCFPDPTRAIYGISEMLINAIEHGNLGITYEEKSALLREGTWEEEIKRRLALPENSQKFGLLTFEETDVAYVLRIKDQGTGFDWKSYMEITPERALSLNGRGIATSKLLSFSHITYLGDGSEVECVLEK